MVVAGSLGVVADGMGKATAGAQEVASRLRACVSARSLPFLPIMPGGRSEEEQRVYLERPAAIDEEASAKRRRRANTPLNNEIVGTGTACTISLLGETNQFGRRFPAWRHDRDRRLADHSIGIP